MKLALSKPSSNRDFAEDTMATTHAATEAESNKGENNNKEEGRRLEKNGKAKHENKHTQMQTPKLANNNENAIQHTSNHANKHSQPHQYNTHEQIPGKTKMRALTKAHKRDNLEGTPPWSRGQRSASNNNNKTNQHHAERQTGERLAKLRECTHWSQRQQQTAT
jgi:hypothetical protein